jgi:phosphoglycolate phosphatase-like HAD superfamily hydrolase
LLLQLIELRVTVYLATNKRFTPTKKILKYLGWENWFQEVYTIDKFENEVFKNKTEMLKVLIKKESIDLKGCLYIGDRMDDREASQANQLNSILVGWGYGDFCYNHNLNIETTYASSAKNLFELIVNIK